MRKNKGERKRERQREREQEKEFKCSQRILNKITTLLNKDIRLPYMEIFDHEACSITVDVHD